MYSSPHFVRQSELLRRPQQILQVDLGEIVQGVDRPAFLGHCRGSLKNQYVGNEWQNNRWSGAAKEISSRDLC